LQPFVNRDRVLDLANDLRASPSLLGAVLGGSGVLEAKLIRDEIVPRCCATSEFQVRVSGTARRLIASGTVT